MNCIVKKTLRKTINSLENPIKRIMGVKKDKLDLCSLPPITRHESPIELVPKKLLVKQYIENRKALKKSDKKVHTIKASPPISSDSSGPTVRQSKIENTIMESLLSIFTKHSHPGSILMQPVWRMTRILISKDLKYCKVFWEPNTASAQKQDIPLKVNEALGKSLNAIRFHLQSMINLKFAPNIVFVQEKQATIHDLLQAKQENKVD